MEYLKKVRVRIKSMELLGLKIPRGFNFPKLVDINMEGFGKANVNMFDENGEKKTLRFYEDEIVSRADDYDEPWILQWVSDDVLLTSTEVELVQGTRYEHVTHKYYHFDSEYYGHSDTNLELVEMNIGDFDVYYIKRGS